MVLFTAWQRLKEGNSLIAEEVIKLLKPEDRVELSDLALMFDEEVNIVPDALVLSTSPSTAELSQPAKLHQPAKLLPRSLDTIKNRAILSSLDFIYRYGLYRLVIYPEFLAFILFVSLTGDLNFGTLKFIALAVGVKQVSGSDGEERPLRKNKRRSKQKEEAGKDFSNVVTFGNLQGPKEMPLRRGQDKPEDLEDRLFSNPLAFWSDLNITWGQKLACLRQVINERGFGVGLGVTVPVLDDKEIQELITLISREPKESPLHGLADAIGREKKRGKVEQDRTAKIQENIAEAKKLQSEGELQAAMERAEEAIRLSPDNREASSLKDILAQELENRRKQADIENRLKFGLKTLYESRIRLRDKKITKNPKGRVPRTLVRG